jgi:hypothetical protein
VYCSAPVLFPCCKCLPRLHPVLYHVFARHFQLEDGPPRFVKRENVGFGEWSTSFCVHSSWVPSARLRCGRSYRRLDDACLSLSACNRNMALVVRLLQPRPCFGYNYSCWLQDREVKLTSNQTCFLCCGSITQHAPKISWWRWSLGGAGLLR